MGPCVRRDDARMDRASTGAAKRLRGCQVHPSAEAGCVDRNLRPRLRQLEPLPDQCRLDPFAATDQAFMQPMQRPVTIGMPAGAAQLAVKACNRSITTRSKSRNRSRSACCHTPYSLDHLLFI